MERGIIVQISGPVVDVEIQSGELPRLREELTVEKDGGLRVMEVAQHIGDDVVRCIAMSGTDGLVRGAKAVDTGSPITGGSSGPSTPASSPAGMALGLSGVMV